MLYWGWWGVRFLLLLLKSLGSLMMNVLCCSFFTTLNCVLGAMRPFCSVATVSRPCAPIFTCPIQVLSTMPHISPATAHTTP